MSAIRWVVVIALAGCVQPGPTPSYYGGQQPQQTAGAPGDPAQPSGGGGLTCMQLFGCFQQCTDGQCIQNCLGQADPQAQAAASAAMQCSSQRCANGGGECLQQQCSAEVAACQGTGANVAYAAPQPAAQEQMIPGQPHTTANILPWMTGDWIGTNHQFQFFADGRVRRSTSTPMYTDKGSYGCVSRINEIGTVRQEGDLLIMDFPSADGNHCGNRETGPALTVRYRITWESYGETVYLQLNDIDCTAGAMWCNDRLRRR
jgi:hypothetical protein